MQMPTTQHLRATENRLVAMAHPLRAVIFKVLTHGPASPSQITRELELPRKDLPNVTYHLNQLVKLGCAEELPPAEDASAMRLYKATDRSLVDVGEWEDLAREHPVLAEHLLGEFMQAQVDDWTLAVKAGTLGDDDEFHLTRTRRVLDAEGLREGLEVYERAWREMDEVERRSAERRCEDGTDAIHASSSFALVKVPAPPRDSRPLKT
jgi:Helix-turn-helix domain